VIPLLSVGQNNRVISRETDSVIVPKYLKVVFGRSDLIALSRVVFQCYIKRFCVGNKLNLFDLPISLFT